MNPLLKEHLFSAVISFLAGFFLMIGQDITSLTMESFTDGTALGLVIAALRAGLKLAFGYFVSSYGAKE